MIRTRKAGRGVCVSSRNINFSVFSCRSLYNGRDQFVYSSSILWCPWLVRFVCVITSLLIWRCQSVSYPTPETLLEAVLTTLVILIAVNMWMDTRWIEHCTCAQAHVHIVNCIGYVECRRCYFYTDIGRYIWVEMNHWFVLYEPLQTNLWIEDIRDCRRYDSVHTHRMIHTTSNCKLHKMQCAHVILLTRGWIWFSTERTVANKDSTKTM